MRLQRPVPVPCSSMGDLLHRAHTAGLLVPDPLDFAWRYVHECAPVRVRKKHRPDHGLALYLGGVPERLRPAAEGVLLAEWAAAVRMLAWRYDELRRRGEPRHPLSPPLREGYHPDQDLVTRVPACGALAVVHAQPPHYELAARRFDRWLHGVHEVVVCERRLQQPNALAVVPWQVAGPAIPLASADGHFEPDRRGMDRGVEPVIARRW